MRQQLGDNNIWRMLILYRVIRTCKATTPNAAAFRFVVSFCPACVWAFVVHVGHSIEPLVEQGGERRSNKFLWDRSTAFLYMLGFWGCGLAGSSGQRIYCACARACIVREVFRAGPGLGDVSKAAWLTHARVDRQPFFSLSPLYFPTHIEMVARWAARCAPKLLSCWVAFGGVAAAIVSSIIGLNTCRPSGSCSAEQEPVRTGGRGGNANDVVSRTGPGSAPLGPSVVLVGAVGAGTWAIVGLDLQQLAALAALALVYYLAQSLRASRWLRPRNAGAAPGVLSRGSHRHAADSSEARAAKASSTRACAAAPKLDVRQESRSPVCAPVFRSTDFAAQSLELLAMITPTAESEHVARRLAERAQRAIELIFPEIDVVSFVSGDIASGTAFGVAVPEVDIVASASPHTLVQHLQGRLSKGGLSMARMDARKLQKSAIRVCTDQLVSSGGFKFRRSAFRCQEPKVTLVAPVGLAGCSQRSIPVDFSVNCVSPLYNAALIQECTSIDTRSKDLVLLVRRWAKDRGICHVAKGHLPPYAWTLLTVYYLQVGFDGAPLLPPLQGFRMVSRMVVRHGGGDDGKWVAPAANCAVAQMSVAALFCRFINFYSRGMSWQSEAVSVRLGRRAQTAASSMVPQSEESKRECCLSVEDPFEPERNLGTCVTPLGMTRLREELDRADALLESGCTWTELLEPWAPAGRDEEDGADDADEPSKVVHRDRAS